MQAGTMYFKLVTRKLQGSKRAEQFMLLAGATSVLTQSTADFYETLSPATVLSQEEIVNVIDKLKKVGSYSSTRDITNPGVVKKLMKLFSLDGDDAETPIPSFAALGIGSYL